MVQLFPSLSLTKDLPSSLIFPVTLMGAFDELSDFMLPFKQALATPAADITTTSASPKIMSFFTVFSPLMNLPARFGTHRSAACDRRVIDECVIESAAREA